MKNSKLSITVNLACMLQKNITEDRSTDDTVLIGTRAP